MKLAFDWEVPHALPALDGHFVGEPIVPGVVLLSRCVAAARGETGARLRSVRVAKFHAPARPGDRLLFTLEGATEQVRFIVQRGDATVASGTLQFEA